MNRFKRTAVRVGIAVVASGTAIGIALTVGVAAGSNDTTRTRPATHASAQVAQTVPAQLSSAFGFLTAASSSALPASLLGDVGPGDGVDPSLAREAGSVGSHPLWMVPGSTSSCLEFDDGGSSCGSNTLALQHGLWLILKPVSGAASTVYGIVPDGTTVSSDGGSVNIARDGNAVMVTPSSSEEGHFTVGGPDGSTIDYPVDPATDLPQADGKLR